MTGKNAVLDSNIFVYISKKQLDYNKLLEPYDNFGVSVISYMEVMGYDFEDKGEEEIVENLFNRVQIFNIDNAIVKKVIEIRKKKKIKFKLKFVYLFLYTTLYTE